MPGRSFSTFQVILIIGVLFKLILISFPNPDAALLAMLLNNFHFHLNQLSNWFYYQLPLTFLTSSLESSVSVNSKILTSSANV